MAENEFKWYSIFVVLFGTTLSIADPVTDILTVVEFYRADHKTWFVVGLTFIILPSFFFFFPNLKVTDVDSCKEESQCKFWLQCTNIFVLGCNPLLPAWLKLKTLSSYLKKLLKRRQDSDTHQTGEDLDELLFASDFAVLIEAALEAAPQFIIQLYAMVVQQQSVSIIQMVSLPVSFLSLVWASTIADRFSNGDDIFSVKDRVLLFSTHLFILSSRLFAVALFTVSYKWWVTGVLIVHCTAMTLIDTIWVCGGQSFDCGIALLSVFFFFHWLRDDWSMLRGNFEIENKETHRGRMLLVSNVLFVIENITMILLFYFSHFPHTWYSLPVTICVCLFAVLGAVMRLTHFYFLCEDSDDEDSDDQSNNTDQVQQQSHSNLVEVAATFNGGKSLSNLVFVRLKFVCDL